MKLIWTIIIGYLVYKIVFDFLLPVGRATSQVRSQLKKMQSTQDNQFQHQAQSSKPQKESSDKKEFDYIDFEDVKD